MTRLYSKPFVRDKIHKNSTTFRLTRENCLDDGIRYLYVGTYVAQCIHTSRDKQQKLIKCDNLHFGAFRKKYIINHWIIWLHLRQAALGLGAISNSVNNTAVIASSNGFFFASIKSNMNETKRESWFSISLTNLKMHFIDQCKLWQGHFCFALWFWETQ